MLYQTMTVIGDGVGFHHMSGWGWGGMMVVWFLMVILVAVIAWALLADGRSSRSSNRAVELLDERYARGEIDRDDYAARKKDLSR